MPLIKINDIRIYYEIQGEGDPLVLIMGLGGTVHAWSRQLPAFSQRYRTLVFDNRGAGATDKPDQEYSIALFAQDTVRLLDSLGISRAHLLGLSMGGMIAQEIALSYPERVACLILCCTNCGWRRSIPPAAEVLQTLTTREGLSPEEMVRRSLPFMFSREYLENQPADVEEFVALSLREPQPEYAFKRQLAATMSFDSWGRLGRIKSPTLVMTGKEDLLIPPQNSQILAQGIPSAQLAILAGGHGFFWEQAQQFNQTVLDFLAYRSG